MAQEIRYSVALTVKNGNYQTSWTPSGTVDQAAVGAASGVASVGTSEEDMAIADVTTEGLFFCQNLDADHFVTWGPKSAGAMVAMGKLMPGEVGLFRFKPGVTLRWQADTATVKVFYTLLQN